MNRGNPGKPVEFRRALGLFDATNLVVGCMIGSGIFVVISKMTLAPDPARGIWGVPYPGLLMLVWIVCGLITVLGAVSYAELSSSFPRAGGEYVYLREAYGPFWAFLYGWTVFFAIQAAGLAAITILFGRAAVALFSHQSYVHVSGEIWPVRLAAVAAITFLTIWNIFGVRMGAMLQNLFTVLKVSALLTLIGLAFLHPPAAAGTSLWPAGLSPELTVGFGTAMIGAFWAYSGWRYVLCAGEEVVNARRTLPLALLLGTGIVTVLYCLASWMYLHLIPVGALQQIWETKGIAAVEAAKLLMGGAGAIFVTATIVCSTFGAANGSLLAVPRLYYAMARDRLFFPWVAQLHPVHRTPVTAFILQGLSVAALILIPGQTFETLIVNVEFAQFLFSVSVVAGIFILRKKLPDRPRPFKAPSIAPILYVLAVLAFLANTLRTHPVESGFGLLIVGSGAVVYLFARKGFSGERPEEPTECVSTPATVSEIAAAPATHSGGPRLSTPLGEKGIPESCSLFDHR